MPLNRRGFFSAVSSAFAGAPATKALAVAPRIVAAPPYEFEVPGWKICWTGWKDSFSQSVQCGQWLAAPVNQYGEFDRERFPVYSSIPGSCATYLPGRMFDICMKYTQPYPEVGTPEALRELGRRNALGLVLDVVGNERHWIKLPRDSWSAPDIYKAWDRYKPASQFQLDSMRFIKERFPGMRGWEDNYGNTFFAERKRLLGF